MKIEFRLVFRGMLYKDRVNRTVLLSLALLILTNLAVQVAFWVWEFTDNGVISATKDVATMICIPGSSRTNA
jgi:hypothetical protein